MAIALSILLFASALAQETSPAPSSSSPPKTATSTAPGASLPTPQTGQTSQALAEVLKLVDAGVHKDIIRLFVEKSAATYELTADDVVTLKRRGVSDEITSVLLSKRPDPQGAPPAQARRTRVAREPIPPPAYLSSGGIDPDSYAYFQRYNLHPRAIAAAYATAGLLRIWPTLLGQPLCANPFPLARVCPNS